MHTWMLVVVCAATDGYATDGCPATDNATDKFMRCMHCNWCTGCAALCRHSSHQCDPHAHSALLSPLWWYPGTTRMHCCCFGALLAVPSRVIIMRACALPGIPSTFSSHLSSPVVGWLGRVVPLAPALPLAADGGVGSAGGHERRDKLRKRVAWQRVCVRCKTPRTQRGSKGHVGCAM